MFRNAILVSAAAASVLLASSPSFALIPMGTIEAYYVQDGQNGVIPSRETTSDNVVAVTREDRTMVAPAAMEPAEMSTNRFWVRERTPSGKN